MFERIKNILYQYLKNTLINVIYDTIYMFSSLQIRYNKTKRYLIGTSENKNNEEEYNVDLELYDDGYLIKNIKMNEYLKKWSSDNLNFDYMIVSNKTNLDYKLRLINNKCKCCMKWPFELSWVRSKINFMSIYVIFNENDLNMIFGNSDVNKEYLISLKVNDNNYYVVGNKIDSKFIKYYMMKYNNIHIPENLDYTIQLFDHNAKLKIIKYPDEIEIKEEDYDIIKKCNE
jgi:hypothetical protein